MKFADRLHTALFENVLTEMASFSLPEPLPLPDRQGQTVKIKYLDMRWEDYKNPYISRWGQWTPFIAELPRSNKYLIWNGIKAWISDHGVPEFFRAPQSWWKMAQGMDDSGNIVMKPKVMRKVEV